MHLCVIAFLWRNAYFYRLNGASNEYYNRIEQFKDRSNFERKMKQQYVNFFIILFQGKIFNSQVRQQRWGMINDWTRQLILTAFSVIFFYFYNISTDLLIDSHIFSWRDKHDLWFWHSKRVGWKERKKLSHE